MRHTLKWDSNNRETKNLNVEIETNQTTLFVKSHRLNIELELDYIIGVGHTQRAFTSSSFCCNDIKNLKHVLRELTVVSTGKWLIVALQILKKNNEVKGSKLRLIAFQSENAVTADKCVISIKNELGYLTKFDS
jgi:hypothetical protein